MEDVEFFLMFANKQNTDNPSGSRICFSKLKFYLDKILCKGWNNSETDAKPMTLYNLEVNNNIIPLYHVYHLHILFV